MAPHRARGPLRPHVMDDAAAAGAIAELNELLWALPISLDAREIAAGMLERGARLFRSPLAGLWATTGADAGPVGAFGLTDKKAEQLWAGLGLADAPPEPLNLFGDRLAGAGAFGKRRLGALLAMPLESPASGLLGWLVFARLDAEPYTDFEAHLLGIIASRVAVALDNARLYRQAEDRARDLALLAEVSTLLVGATELDRLLHAVVGRVLDVFGLSMASIHLVDPATDLLAANAIRHRDAATHARLTAWLEAHPLRADQGLTARVFATGRPYFTPNLAEDPIARQDLKDALGVGACLVLPLIARGKVVGGMYWFKAGRHGTLDEAVIPLASQLAGEIGMAAENARLYQALERRAAEGDTQLQALYEALAANVETGRRWLTTLTAELREDLAALADACVEAPSAELASTVARMRARLDVMEQRIAEGRRA